MKTFQLPSGELISAVTPEGAIQKARQAHNQTDKYYDRCWNLKLHSDGIHLIPKPEVK